MMIVSIVLLILMTAWQLNAVQPTSKRMYFAALALKITGGIFFYLLYLRLGEGDTLTYMKAADSWTDLLYSDPSLFFRKYCFTSESISGLFINKPRAVFFTKICVIPALLTGGSHVMMTVFFALLSFFAAWFIYEKLQYYDPEKTSVWFTIIFLFPGTWFWTGGMIKETVVVSALYLLAGSFLSWYLGKSRYLSIIILSALSLLILIKVKYYVAAVFVPILVAAYYIGLLQRSTIVSRRSWFAYLLPVVMVFSLAIFVINLSPNFQPGNLLDRIVTDHHRLQVKTPGDFGIQYTDFKPEVSSFLYNSPKALVSGLFRPFLWEVRSGYQLAAGVQNLVLLLLSVLAVILAVRIKKPPNIWIMLLLFYSIVMACFLAFATPNFGTLERYKVLYQPFFLMVLSDVIDYIFRILKPPISGLLRK